MTFCNSHPMLFPSFEGLKVEGSFEGGDVSSDGGVQLLRLADRRLGLSAALARVLPDPRDPLKVEHTVRDLLRQRIYGLACGYEDLNDHDTLRDDLCWQSAVERTRALASFRPRCAGSKRGPIARRRWRCTECSSISSSPATRSRRRNWCSISMRPMTGCMGCRKAAPFTPTTGTGVSCRSTCFAASACSAPICGAAMRTRRAMRGRCSSCSARGCARRGPR